MNKRRLLTIGPLAIVFTFLQVSAGSSKPLDSANDSPASVLESASSANWWEVSFVLNGRPVSYTDRPINGEVIEANLNKALKVSQNDSMKPCDPVIVLARQRSSIEQVKAACRQIGSDRLSMEIAGDQVIIKYLPSGDGMLSHRDCVNILESLAILHYRNGDYIKAEEELKQAIVRVPLDNEALQVAEIDDLLAWVYRAEGNFNEAESCSIESLKLRKRLLPKDAASIRRSYSNLEWLCYDNGDFESAKRFERKASKETFEHQPVSRDAPLWARIEDLAKFGTDLAMLDRSESTAEVKSIRDLLQKMLATKQPWPRLSKHPRN
jgi:tetratricopeptide (TPR) repeat protein